MRENLTKITILSLAWTLSSSCVPYDIARLNSPSYNQDNWNGIKSGNNNLSHLYRNYSAPIERLLQTTFSANYKEKYTHAFSRRSHSPIEKTLVLAQLMPEIIKGNGGTEKLVERISYHFQMPNYMARSFISDMLAVRNDIKLQNSAICYSYAIDDPNGKRKQGSDTPGQHVLEKNGPTS